MTEKLHKPHLHNQMRTHDYHKIATAVKHPCRDLWEIERRDRETRLFREDNVLRDLTRGACRLDNQQHRNRSTALQIQNWKLKEDTN